MADAIALPEPERGLQRQSKDYADTELDQYGQRIDIEIAVPSKDPGVGKISYMRSGWMIEPDGTIRLNTPFSGFTR